MAEQLQRRYGRVTKRMVVDAGYHKNADTEWAATQGIKVYGPHGHSRDKTDPYAPRSGDGPGVAA